MPDIFTTRKVLSDEEIYESGIGDTRGYVHDGAYIARARLGPSRPETAKTTVEPQEAFTAVLKERFLEQRREMHLPPQADAIAALDERHPISFPQGYSKAYTEWHRLIRT